MTGRRSSIDYLQQLKALLPRGRAWICGIGSTLYQLLSGLAEEFARIESAAWAVRDEADPSITSLLLPEWEAFAGLPESTCPAVVATTTEERRAALKAKLQATGGASHSYFAGIITALGYEAQIEVFRPFVCGRARCGDRLNGAPSVRHIWRVRVAGPRVTMFRAGMARCGDRLGSIARAEDLECKLGLLQPAHTKLIVSYEGA